MLDTQAFERLFEGAEEALRPVLLLAFDTGMRKEELLALRWEQIDLDAGTIQLAPEDTKTEEGRLIVLTERAKEALRPMPSGSRKQSSFFSRCMRAMSVRVP